MIGSRLLFSGYGVGFKSKPLHAGFLGQDALLVHNEAHLEPAFQRLIESIRQEQKRSNELGEPLGVLSVTTKSRPHRKQRLFLGGKMNLHGTAKPQRRKIEGEGGLVDEEHRNH